MESAGGVYEISFGQCDGRCVAGTLTILTDWVTFTILTKDNKEISCDEGRKIATIQTAELRRVTT